MIIYILIGIVFMFLMEHITRLIRKEYKPKYPKAFMPFSWFERITGIFFWPVLLAVFLYFFLKEFLK